MIDLHRVPTLALDFASPWLLWGTALGALPIIIHLLHRRRYQEAPWAAMRFLMEAARKNSRRIRLEQLLLLAVRVLILVMLAAALARPFAESFGRTALSESASVHRMIVVDVSFSMGYQPAGDNRFARAKAIARDIVASAGTGDAFNLLRISGLPPRVIVRRPSYQHDDMIDEIESLSLTEQQGTLPLVLESLEQLLGEAGELDRREIYFISDLQKGTWSSGSAAEQSRLHEQFQKLGEQARVVLIDVGQSPSANAAVTGFRVDDELAAVGEPVRLRATVRQFGVRAPQAAQLDFSVDGQLVESRPVSVPPDEEVHVDITHTFAAGGERELAVRLGDDALQIDNHRFLVCRVRDALRILLVNGRQSGIPSETATYYVETALQPGRSAYASYPSLQLRVIGEGELLGEDLSAYDGVVVCNVGQFTAQEAELLRAFVHGGGGLVLCLGERVQADNYNRLLGSDGAGILPAELLDRVGNAAFPKDAFEFETANLDHPIVSVFEGRVDAGLERTLTFEYFRARPLDDNRARVALQFRSGEPAIVEAAAGQGRVVLYTTSLDAGWGTWPLQESFLPIVHESVRFAVSGGSQYRQLVVGEPLTRTFPSRGGGLPGKLVLPNGEEAAMIQSHSGNATTVSFERTYQSGFYALEHSPSNRPSERFAVNVDPRESDLAKLQAEELKSDLLAGIDFDYRTEWRDTLGPVVAENGPAHAMARWLLLATLCLVAVEQLMAWHFYYGLVLLYAVAAVALVERTISMTVSGGIGLSLFLLAGLVLLVRIRRDRGRRPAASIGPTAG